ncbi:MAG: zinc ribbon domain-containing protein [Anaerolineae bacterium]|nr:zinc ribbon domain-containing protein [Anaerolineae bacterium]
MLENISNVIIIATSVIGAITAALVAGLAIWTFRDIRARSRDILVQILATVLVAVIPLVGILIYLLLRPRETLNEAYVRALEEEALLSAIEDQEFCPSCGRRVGEDMVFCPACHTKLRNACGSCKRTVHLSWDLCPYCGVELQPEMPQVRKPSSRQVTSGTSQAQRQVSHAKRAPALAEPEEVVEADASAANGAEPAAKLGNLLDRIGGAVEGALGRQNGASSSK